MTKIDSKRLIGYWANFSRAYEIALVGNKSISIYADKEYTNADEDIAYLKSIFSDVRYELDGDIQIELVKPPSYDPNFRFEGIEDIQKRARICSISSVNYELEDTPYHKKDACEGLLKTATQRLNLSLKDIEIIWSLASVIAKMDKEKFIDVNHIAEAIHYRCCKCDQDCYLPDAYWTDVKVAQFMRKLVTSITEGTLRSWEERHFLSFITQIRNNEL